VGRLNVLAFNGLLESLLPIQHSGFSPCLAAEFFFHLCRRPLQPSEHKPSSVPRELEARTESWYILVYMPVYMLVYVPVLVNVPNQPVAEETRVLYSYSGHLFPVPLQQPPCSHCNNRMCIPSKLLDVMSPQLAPLHAPLPRCSEGRQTPLVGAYVHTVRKSQRCRHCSISRTSQAACGSRGGCCGPKGVRCPSPAQGRQRANMAAISAVYVRHCGIGSCPGGGTIGLGSICVQNHHGLADG